MGLLSSQLGSEYNGNTQSLDTDGHKNGFETVPKIGRVEK